MVPIKDLQTYVSGMEKSIIDKLWWLDVMPKDITTVYDYGCADGALLSAVHLLRPDLELIGYDCNKAMVEAAQTRLPQAKFSLFPCTLVPPHTIIIVSSVLHEVFSYQSSPKEDFRNIFGCKAECVAVRDMFYNQGYADYSQYTEDLIKVFTYGSKDQIRDFEEIWGSLSTRKNLVHFLLKYRYVVNWDREVRENYFSVNSIDLVAKAEAMYKYRLVHEEFYILPFVQDIVKEDFGIDMTDKTHGKLLFIKDNK